MMEVYRFDKIKMCFARPIQDNVNSVWVFKSLLEVAEEVNINYISPVLNSIWMHLQF